MSSLDASSVGAACFGISVGFITYRTLIRTTDKAAISDLATVIGVVGGATVTTLFDPKKTDLFAWYSIGLLIGIVAYGLVFFVVNGKDKFATVMGAPDRGPAMPAVGIGAEGGGPHV